MHLKSPFWDPKSKNFLGRGDHTPPAAPRSSRLRRLVLGSPVCNSWIRHCTGLHSMESVCPCRTVDIIYEPNRENVCLWLGHGVYFCSGVTIYCGFIYLFVYVFSTDTHACMRYIYNKQLQPAGSNRKASRSTNNFPDRHVKSYNRKSNSL